jgi:hypothetical protein
MANLELRTSPTLSSFPCVNLPFLVGCTRIWCGQASLSCEHEPSRLIVTQYEPLGLAAEPGK